MPSRNVLKMDVAERYYHVYARGVSKQPIFLSVEDFTVFLNLLKRYLSPEPSKDQFGRTYHHLRGKVELLSYCLMGNHFHMLIYQEEAGAMAELMRGVLSSYSRYFNKTHQRSGPLFETRYKASMISNQAYLLHISRYIHLNPKDWQTYPFSSIHSYLGERSEDWLQPERMLSLFDGKDDYDTFMKDYEDSEEMFDEIKYELAGY